MIAAVDSAVVPDAARDKTTSPQLRVRNVPELLISWKSKIFVVAELDR